MPKRGLVKTYKTFAKKARANTIEALDVRALFDALGVAKRRNDALLIGSRALADLQLVALSRIGALSDRVAGLESAGSAPAASAPNVAAATKSAFRNELKGEDVSFALTFLDPNDEASHERMYARIDAFLAKQESLSQDAKAALRTPLRFTLADVMRNRINGYTKYRTNAAYRRFISADATSLNAAIVACMGAAKPNFVVRIAATLRNIAPGSETLNREQMVAIGAFTAVCHELLHGDNQPPLPLNDYILGKFAKKSGIDAVRSALDAIQAQGVAPPMTPAGAPSAPGAASPQGAVRAKKGAATKNQAQTSSSAAAPKSAKTTTKVVTPAAGRKRAAGGAAAAAAPKKQRRNNIMQMLDGDDSESNSDSESSSEYYDYEDDDDMLSCDSDSDTDDDNDDDDDA